MPAEQIELRSKKFIVSREVRDLAHEALFVLYSMNWGEMRSNTSGWFVFQYGGRKFKLRIDTVDTGEDE